MRVTEQLKLKVGDRLVMEWATFGNNRRDGWKPPVSVVVTDVKRVWVTVEIDDEGYTGWNKEFKFRLDTQDSGDRNYSQHNHDFYSLEQYAKLTLARSCDQVLKEAYIDISPRSRWYQDDDFKVALASFIKKWDKEHPTEPK